MDMKRLTVHKTQYIVATVIYPSAPILFDGASGTGACEHCKVPTRGYSTAGAVPQRSALLLATLPQSSHLSHYLP